MGTTRTWLTRASLVVAFVFCTAVIVPGGLAQEDGQYQQEGSSYAIKQKAQKDIWLFGGSSLTKSFIDNQLLDECMLAVHPIVLGAGKALFADLNKRIQMQLIDSKTFSSGLIQLIYSVNKS